MARTFFLFLSCCIIMLHAGAQEKTGKSLLWKISGKSLQQPSYLYGTFHLLCPEDLHFSAATQEAFKKAGELFVEINTEDPAVIAKMQSLMLMPQGYSLKALFSESNYGHLSAYFKDSVGMDLQLLDRLKPMVIMSALSARSAPCSPPAFCDQVLMKLAKEQQKPIRELEKVEAQVAIFDSIPDTEEAASLARMVMNMDSTRLQFRQLLDAYKQEDIDKLYQLVNESPDMIRFRPLMLDNRNRSWIPVITEQVQQGATFFAFGAGHLGGPNGVRALLREAGYTVEPVQ